MNIKVSSITTRSLKSSMKVLLRISNNRTDLADMFMLLLNSGSGNNSARGNMVVTPSHFIVITLSSLSAFDLSAIMTFLFLWPV